MEGCNLIFLFLGFLEALCLERLIVPASRAACHLDHFLTDMGSRLHVRDIKHGAPLPYQDDIRAYTKGYAEALDAQDPLREFRNEFIIPSKRDLKRKTLAAEDGRFHRYLNSIPVSSIIYN